MLATKSLIKRPPRLAGLEPLTNKILGRAYNLSLVWIKNGRTVLSYPLTPKLGEIFIDPQAARAAGFSLPYLLIHGLLHLKGCRHGSKMDGAEKKFLTWYLNHYGRSHHRTRLRHRHRAAR